MAELTVVYFSKDKLSCRGCSPSDVILCVKPEKVAPHVCPNDGGEQTFEYSYIDAEMTDFRQNGCYWQYTFTYNSDDVEGGDPISSSDILGVLCRSCLTSYIDQKVGDEPFMEVVEGEGIKFTSPHGCEFIFATGCEGVCNVTTVLDTESIDMTITGTSPAPYVISADVILSADPDNIISIESDGLFAAQNLLAVTDSATVDFTISGTIPQTLSAAVKLSTAVVNNQTVAVADGLHTPPAWSFGGVTRFYLASASTLVYNQATVVLAGTADASDNSDFRISGGGGFGTTRGAYLQVAGNEHATPGIAVLEAGNVTGATAGILAPNATGYVYFSNGGTEKWRVTGTSTADFAFSTGTGRIIANTADAADTGTLQLSGGGGVGTTRGARVTVAGNEASVDPGSAQLVAGNVAGAFVQLASDAANSYISMRTESAEQWRFRGSASAIFEFQQTEGVIQADTADAGDSARLRIAGGGAPLASRGAYIELRGNEFGADNGVAALIAGDAATARILLSAENASGTIDIHTAGSQRWQVQADGDLAQNSATGGSLLGQRDSSAIVSYTTSVTLAPNGANLAAATQITKNYNFIINSGTGGVKLFDDVTSHVGYSILLISGHASSINVYPPTGSGQINGGGAGVPFVLATTEIGIFIKVAADTWFAGVLA